MFVVVAKENLKSKAFIKDRPPPEINKGFIDFMAEPSIISLVKSYVNNRGFMLENKLVKTSGEKLAALKKIKIHLAFVRDCKPENQKIMVKFLLPELILLMPGKPSAFYSSMSEKMEQIKSLVNGGR